MQQMIRYILLNKNTWTCSKRCLLVGLSTMTGAIALTLLTQYFLGWPPGAGILFTGIVFCALVGGIWPGLIATIITYAYLSYFAGEFSFARTFNIIGAGAACSLGIAWGRWYRVELFDTLNGNLERLQKAIEIIDDLRGDWENRTEQYRRQRIIELGNVLGNLAQLVVGWHQIRQEMDTTKAELKRGKK